MKQFFHWVPIAITSIGVAIHLFGTLGLFQLEVHRVVHMAMLIVDSTVVIGLLKKTTWGYWLAVMLYIEQSIGVPYLCYQIFVHNTGLKELVLAGPLVVSCLLILLLNKKLFEPREQVDLINMAK